MVDLRIIELSEMTNLLSFSIYIINILVISKRNLNRVHLRKLQEIFVDVKWTNPRISMDKTSLPSLNKRRNLIPESD